jgi:HPt (histidine-containing phosphotransfer) domain-containing protein
VKLENILEELKRDYVASLPSRVETMSGLLKAGNAALLKDDFHKLKGSGKTYGVPEVSSVAELGESICRDKQSEMGFAIPVLLQLLTEIHQKQSRQESFDVGRDPRFSQLKQLV